jgi:type II secretory pathway pseudopilin PulG
MHSNSTLKNEQGFTILEMIISLTIMILILGAVMTLANRAISIATVTYELTDAQESLRTAQEFINRDLMSAGDGLKNLSNIPITKTFVQNYLTRNPVVDPLNPTASWVTLGILTTDNDVPASQVVYGLDPTVPTNPLVYVRSTPNLTDRQTILEIDPDFTPVALLAPAIDATGSTITIADTDVGRFTAGEIYFITSTAGGTFVTLTNVVDTPLVTTSALSVASGDKFGLNVTGLKAAGGRLSTITNNGTLATSLQRMRMIHYYVNADGMLMRRVFGVKGVGFRESAIADHVVSVQFLYSLAPDDNGVIVAPVNRLSDGDMQIAVRQVEVTVTVETPHAVSKGQRQTISSTTSTSVRNMQFRQALQPKATL